MGFQIKTLYRLPKVKTPFITDKRKKCTPLRAKSGSNFETIFEEYWNTVGATEPAISNRKFNAMTTTKPSHSTDNTVNYIITKLRLSREESSKTQDI